MPSGRKPSASEVLDLLDRLQRDDTQRNAMSSGYEIFKVAVSEELLNVDGADWLARCMQELHGEQLIAHGSVSAGVHEPIVWDDHWIQSVHDWRVTSAGRQDASLFRRERAQDAISRAPNGSAVSQDATSDDATDLFVCHASEDKEAVARPLAAVLSGLGWRVWLDELQLTVGDSLSGRIDAALARTRFGVVILSPAFFMKPWTKRELSGLAAREIAADAKVILPVWHNVNHAYVVHRSPTLADRVAANTKDGIAHVAEDIGRALRAAAVRPHGDTESTAALAGGSPIAHTPWRVPATEAEQAELLAIRPPAWEYLMFAGVLLRGRNRCAPKWHDHEYRLPRGPRRSFGTDEMTSFLIQETDWVGTYIGALDRVFTPEAQERAFGAPGESGDPVRIQHMGDYFISTYEQMLDWAAALRAASVPEPYRESLELAARFVDQPLQQMHDLIQRSADEIPLALAQAEDGNVTEPVRLTLSFIFDLGDELLSDYVASVKRAYEQVERGDY